MEVVEGNLIPHWACTDWEIYKETLFHVLQNAIKFNNDNGTVKIVVSFHTLQDELKEVAVKKRIDKSSKDD